MSELLKTSGQVCAHFDVSRVTLHRWRRDQEHFPKPKLDLGGKRGAIWDLRELVAWDQDRRAGSWLTTLRAYREHGTIAAAARASEVNQTTARYRLRRLGELPTR